MNVRERFLNDIKHFEAFQIKPKYLVVAVELPTGATEVITNAEELASKVEYYKNAYDDDFKLKTNSNVRIVGYMII
jgi:hypothetical protein